MRKNRNQDKIAEKVNTHMKQNSANQETGGRLYMYLSNILP